MMSSEGEVVIDKFRDNQDDIIEVELRNFHPYKYNGADKVYEHEEISP